MSRAERSKGRYRSLPENIGVHSQYVREPGTCVKKMRPHSRECGRSPRNRWKSQPWRWSSGTQLLPGHPDALASAVTGPVPLNRTIP